MKELKDCDWVFHVTMGWLKSSNINNEWIRAGGYSYKQDGRCGDCKLPSIYPYNPFDPDDQPPVTFKEGEVIMVRDGDDAKWVSDIFERISSKETYDYVGVTCSWRYARKLNATERGE